jgi:hypothetical protein
MMGDHDAAEWRVSKNSKEPEERKKVVVYMVGRQQEA